MRLDCQKEEQMAIANEIDWIKNPHIKGDSLVLQKLNMQLVCVPWI